METGRARICKYYLRPGGCMSEEGGRPCGYRHEVPAKWWCGRCRQTGHRVKDCSQGAGGPSLGSLGRDCGAGQRTNLSSAPGAGERQWPEKDSHAEKTQVPGILMIAGAGRPEGSAAIDRTYCFNCQSREHTIQGCTAPCIFFLTGGCRNENCSLPHGRPAVETKSAPLSEGPREANPEGGAVSKKMQKGVFFMGAEGTLRLLQAPPAPVADAKNDVGGGAPSVKPLYSRAVGGVVYEQILPERRAESNVDECKLCDVALRSQQEWEEHKRSEKHKFRTKFQEVLNRRSAVVHNEKKRVCYNCGAPGHIADACPTGFCVKYAIGECRRESCQLAHKVL